MMDEAQNTLYDKIYAILEVKKLKKREHGLAKTITRPSSLSPFWVFQHTDQFHLICSFGH